ncbi:MAG: HAD-IA family hydrolase [Acidovorax sp.]
MTEQATFDAVIFDADGTLVDSEGIGLGLLAEHAAALGVGLSAPETGALRGESMAGCLEYLARRLGRALPGDFEPRLRQAMAAAFAERLRPMPGALEVLSSLRVPFCVATNGPRSKVSQTLEVTGLRPWLDERIFCAPEVGSFKPQPGLFLAAAQALGVAPGRCAVVEDSAPGMLAGIRAGMQVFAVAPVHALPDGCDDKVRVLERLQDLLGFQRPGGA